MMMGGHKQKWGAVAPAPLISRRKSSCRPRLETILEEGYDNDAAFFSKKLFLVLPVVLSTVCCFLLYKDVALCA
ncbi:hypothetical protein PTKIN_Ptkin01aG0084300 [Pterospermum kingtungense]